MKKMISILTLCLMLSEAMAQTNDIAIGFIKANETLMSANYSQAITEFQTIYEVVSNKQDKAIVAQSLATSYIASGKYKEAESLLLNTIISFENTFDKNTSTYRELLNSISVVYLELNNFNKANDYVQKAKDLFEENLDFGNGYVRCLSIMAGIQVELGHKTLGRILIDVAVRQARSNYKKLDKEQIIESSLLISNKTNKDLYKFQVSQYAQILSNAAATYDRMGYIVDAVSLIKEAISVSSSVGVELANCYGNLAGLYLYKSNYREAISNYEKALNLVKSPSQFDELSMDLSLAKMFANDKDVADVTLKNSKILRNHQRYAFTFLSESERQNYWENSGHNIPLQNYIYQQHGSDIHKGVIYDNLLYSKGLLLRTTNELTDKLFKAGNQNLLNLHRTMLNTKILMMRETDQSIINLLQHRCDSIEKILVDFVGQKEVLTTTEFSWKDIQSKLKDSDVAIEFYCIPNIIMSDNYINSKTEGVIYCAAILKKEYKYPQIFKLATSKELEMLIEESPYGSVELYKKIWKPLISELKGEINVYFSADRELHKVALESLMNEEGCSVNSLWNIYRLSSTRELVMKKNEIQLKHYALFGGLNYNAAIEDIEDNLSRNGLRSVSSGQNRNDSIPLSRWGMRYLPGTKVEVESIQNELQQNNSIITNLYTGLDGTEELLKSLSGKDVNVIHLATHGYFWSKSEANEQKGISALVKNKDKNTSALLRSGILMSGANHALKGDALPKNMEDGIATAQEISNLNYRTVDLVVLSACQSALGDVNGEGVYGLQRGLKLAGVKSLLMTLWPVDDQATQMLMVEFYKNFLNGETKVKSLLNAQRYIKSQQGFEDPEYWAGFVLLDALN